MLGLGLGLGTGLGLGLGLGLLLRLLRHRLLSALWRVGLALHELQLLVEVVERAAHSVVRVGLLLALGRRRRTW